MGLSKNGIIPPSANGPKRTPPITKPTISESPIRAQSLPSIMDGITTNKIPMIVEIMSISPNNYDSDLFDMMISKAFLDFYDWKWVFHVTQSLLKTVNIFYVKL